MTTRGPPPRLREGRHKAALPRRRRPAPALRRGLGHRVAQRHPLGRRLRQARSRPPHRHRRHLQGPREPRHAPHRRRAARRPARGPRSDAGGGGGGGEKEQQQQLLLLRQRTRRCSLQSRARLIAKALLIYEDGTTSRRPPEARPCPRLFCRVVGALSAAVGRLGLDRVALARIGSVCARLARGQCAARWPMRRGVRTFFFKRTEKRLQSQQGPYPGPRISSSRATEAPQGERSHPLCGVLGVQGPTRPRYLAACAKATDWTSRTQRAHLGERRTLKQLASGV